MDWKMKCAQYWEKAKNIWAGFRKGCGVAWRRFRVFLGDARVWLRRVWNVVNEWLTKAKICLKNAFVFLGKHSKHLLGWLAVLALKIRKGVFKLRGWWAGSKCRKWLDEKTKKTEKQISEPVETAPVNQLPQQIQNVQPEQADEQMPVAPAAPRPTPRPRKRGPVATVWNGIKTTVVWIYRLRKYIMAVPVAFTAVKLALANAARLPDMVGLDIQASGEFARMVSRQYAVLGPLGITVFCLVLVICSRKPLLPWLISIFTLILPVLIWMTNYYA